jgi:hypothetical protein
MKKKKQVFKFCTGRHCHLSGIQSYHVFSREKVADLVTILNKLSGLQFVGPALNVKQTSEWYPGNKLFYTELYVPAQNKQIQTETAET